jgi:hypothetical protein
LLKRVPPSFTLLRLLRSRVGLRLHRWRLDPVRSLVSDPSGGGGFACFGPDVNTVYFARHYLGTAEADALAISRRWNPCGIAAAARRLARAHGLAVFSEHSAPAALLPDLLAFDTYADLDIPLPATLEEFLRALPESTLSDVRRVRARGYRPELSRDPAWAAEFHQRHHVPSIRDRHGDDGFVCTPAELAHAFAGGESEWIKVFDGDRCLGAVLGETMPSGYYLHRLGWLDGDPALLSAGVVSALYWFSIRRAIELGLPRVHLGGVMADLNNGLFRYKSKWGARLVPASRRYRRLRLLLDPAHPHARRFLEHHALLARDAAGEFIVLSAHAPTEVPTFKAQAPFLRGWFRLRAAPDPAPDAAKAALPASLRPWFDATPFPSAS